MQSQFSNTCCFAAFWTIYMIEKLGLNFLLSVICASNFACFDCNLKCNNSFNTIMKFYRSGPNVCLFMASTPDTGSGLAAAASALQANCDR